MHTLAKFTSPYGNYGAGHQAKLAIEDVRLMSPAYGTQLMYLVSYEKRGPKQFFVIPELHLGAMRAWLASQAIVGRDTALHYTAAQVLRRVEQYYGTDGLAQIMREIEAAREVIPA